MSDYLIHIEDDKFSSEDYAFLIKNAIPDLSVITISNLPAFIAILPELRSFPPAAILLDLMIPIGDIKEEYPEIDYTDLEGGLACIKLLAEHESTSKIPIIIISARSFSMIKSEINKFKQVISYFSKPIGPEAFDRIIEIIHSSLSLSGKSRKRKSETAMKKFMASIEAKPGAFGVKVDLKKLLIKEKKANIFLHQTGVSLPLHTYR